VLVGLPAGCFDWDAEHSIGTIGYSWPSRRILISESAAKPLLVRFKHNAVIGDHLGFTKPN
jgi:hypothetical protein